MRNKWGRVITVDNSMLQCDSHLMPRSFEQRLRRLSILEFGGRNSLSNFASSYQRAQIFTGSSLLENDSDSALMADFAASSIQDVSPGSSITDLLLESGIGEDSNTRGHNNLNSFQFPPKPIEATPLMDPPHGADLSRRSSHEGADVEGEPTFSYGRSTSAQTVFNSINNLVGIGMMSLPFGMNLAGWFVGSFLLLACAFMTGLTAKIMGLILKRHLNLKTYADMVALYGTPLFLVLVTGLFCLDLCGASLSLVLIFSDFFSILVPHVGKPILKAIIVVAVCLLSFLPLSVLALLSFLGILSVFGVIGLIIMCGFTIHTSPGSLYVPAMTKMWPDNLNDFFMALGIFMSPWGGHPVFPELYRDMIHPSHFNKSIDVSFSFAFLIDYSIAVVGYLMYGISCQDSILKSMMSNTNYPSWTTPIFCGLVGLLPLCKLPLVTRPLISFYESALRLSPKHPSHSLLDAKRVIGRIIFFSLLLAVSWMISSFGRLVSFLGSAICFTVCITLPLLFYIHFLEDEISTKRKVFAWIGIVVSIMGALFGTYGLVIMKS